MKSFKAKLESSQIDHMVYHSQYNRFWKWKIGVESGGKEHILDGKHRDVACRMLLGILPGWQTYRGITCDYVGRLPVSLSNIAHAYNQIRNYSLLDFDQVPTAPLQLIWHELGCVKTASGNRRQLGEYSVIAICKPLMFLWGQTLPFDSRNRENLYVFPYGGSWYFDWWMDTMKSLQKDLMSSLAVVNYCNSKTVQIHGSNYVVPYGRFLDIYYF